VNTRPLTVAIVDDEPLARDCIRLALADDPSVNIVAECADGPSAIDAIIEHRPDVVFLDVQMPGIDGFGVLEAVEAQHLPAIIFVTAYDQHALRAFDVHAVDYLVKPFEDARLREALERARRARSLGEMEARVRALLRDLRSVDEPPAADQPAGQYATRFVVRGDDRAVIVRARDVDWIEASGNYVVLHTKIGEHRMRMSLRALAEQLDPKQFFRIHKSTIVNLDSVREIQPWFGGDYIAILNTGHKLRVSRTHAHRFLKPVQ
jgi:two-component system, LytTR family, response regulator